MLPLTGSLFIRGYPNLQMSPSKVSLSRCANESERKGTDPIVSRQAAFLNLFTFC